MLCYILLTSQLSADKIMAEAWEKVSQAKSISVTKLQTTEEFKRDLRVKFYFRAGGYVRVEKPLLTDISNPKQAWTFRTSKKTYQSKAAVPVSFNINSLLGIEMFNSGLPILSGPSPVVWHNHSTLRIELDGRKVMTTRTKLFVYVAPKTHLPIGISANLGSVTQVTIYENLKVNQPLSDSLFNFVPPAGWTKSMESPRGRR